MKDVVEETIHRAIHQKVRQVDLEPLDKLRRAFADCPIERRAPVIFVSTAKPEFSAVLKTEAGLVAFDTFSTQGFSINSVHVKMADIGRRVAPPRGFVVTTRMGAIGPKLNLVTSLAQGK